MTSKSLPNGYIMSRDEAALRLESVAVAQSMTLYKSQPYFAQDGHLDTPRQGNQTLARFTQDESK